MTARTGTRPPKPTSHPSEAYYARIDSRWLAEPPHVLRCRQGSPRYGWCPNESVATMIRGHHGRPYGYCADHMYGAWIEGGYVMVWAIRPGWTGP
jgi:hypothetical protein